MVVITFYNVQHFLGSKRFFTPVMKIVWNGEWCCYGAAFKQHNTVYEEGVPMHVSKCCICLSVNKHKITHFNIKIFHFRHYHSIHTTYDAMHQIRRVHSPKPIDLTILLHFSQIVNVIEWTEPKKRDKYFTIVPPWLCF